MTTPYYADDLVTLYHGDCLEVTEWLEADVLVTDPPYGTETEIGYGRRRDENGVIHAKEARSGLKIANDATTLTRDGILSLWGDTKPAIVFGSPRLPDPPGEWSDRLVWHKKRPGMNGGPWRYTHESIYARGFIRNGNDNFSVLTAFPTDQHMHIHAKPVALMESLIACAPPGVIAEPCAGSGATLVAARNLGRRVIGVEIEERYCEIIAGRLAQQAFDFSALTSPTDGEHERIDRDPTRIIT